jgi:hypothetical protein
VQVAATPALDPGQITAAGNRASGSYTYTYTHKADWSRSSLHRIAVTRNIRAHRC